MPGQSLSQANIDASPASAERDVVEYDFRLSSTFEPSAVAGIRRIHKVFCRELSQRFIQAFKVAVTVEPGDLQEARYDSYVRSLPSPALLAEVMFDRTGGRTLIDFDHHLGFSLLDLMLGGPGRSTAFRNLTDLELTLFGTLAEHTVGAVGAAFASIADVQPRLENVHSHPSIGHVALSSEPVLLMSFVVTITTTNRTRGLLTVCYPYQSLEPILDAISASASSESLESSGSGAFEAPLHDVEMQLNVRLKDSPLSVAELTRLRPGDVVVFDHEVDEPVVVSAGGVPLFTASVGRKGDKRALSLESWEV